MLFVDFHGVLHPSGGGGADLFVRAPRLGDAFDGAPPEVQIVIASNWRFTNSLGQLRSYLPPLVAQRVVAATGPALGGMHSRYREIETWLRSQRDVADWRALDDSAQLFPPGCPQLILCESHVGIAQPQVDAIRAWWSAAPPGAGSFP